MLKHASVKNTAPVKHRGGPWVHFPSLLSTLDSSLFCMEENIGFLSIAVSVQTAAGKGEAGLRVRPGAPTSAVPRVRVDCPGGVYTSRATAARGGARWFHCRAVMLRTGLRRLLRSPLIKHLWWQHRWRASCDSQLQRLGVSAGLKGAKSKSFIFLSY